MTGCNYPDCGCDWDAICAAEVDRQRMQGFPTPRPASGAAAMLLSEPNVTHGLAIVGPYGSIWHDDVFQRPEDAIAYLDKFWEGNWNRSRWKLALATKTISLDRKSEPAGLFNVTDYAEKQP